jgi:hypothetical protein
MTEVYFAPTKRAQPITLEQLQRRLTAAGLPCTIEEDSNDTHWFVFTPHESTIYASTTGEQVSLATFNFGQNDDLEMGNTIERVMDAIGFSAVETD